MWGERGRGREPGFLVEGLVGRMRGGRAVARVGGRRVGRFGS